jgi:hypothetical protein
MCIGVSGDLFNPSTWSFEFDIIGCIIDPILNAIEGMVRAILTPAIGLPTMEGPGGRWIAFTASPTNPWDALVGTGETSFGLIPTDPGMYWEMVVPLSLALLTIATAFTAIRAGTLSASEAQRQFRRVGIGFLTCFFWIPIASIALNFFNAIAYYIAFGGLDPADATKTFVEFVLAALGGGAAVGAIAFIYTLPPAALIVAAMLFVAMLFTVVMLALRWVLVIMITLAMPIIAAFWAVDVWPLNKFSEMATNVTGVYVGLLMSGLPSAFLFRVIVELDNQSATGAVGNGFGAGGLVVTVMVLLFPVYIFKTTTTMVNWAAGIASEIGQTGQQPVQRGLRTWAMGKAVGDEIDDGSGRLTRVKERVGDVRSDVESGDGVIGRNVGKLRGKFNEMRGAHTEETFERSRSGATNGEYQEEEFTATQRDDYDPDIWEFHDQGAKDHDVGQRRRFKDD